MVYNENHLVCEAMKQIGKAFATGCLAVTKMKDRRMAKDLKAQENTELRKEIKRQQMSSSILPTCNRKSSDFKPKNLRREQIEPKRLHTYLKKGASSWLKSTN